MFFKGPFQSKAFCNSMKNTEMHIFSSSLKKIHVYTEEVKK